MPNAVVDTSSKKTRVADSYSGIHVMKIWYLRHSHVSKVVYSLQYAYLQVESKSHNLKSLGGMAPHMKEGRSH